MRNNIIERARVREMAESGLSQKEIAKRLHCSDRQVRRIVHGSEVMGHSSEVRRAVREDEHLCWRVAFAIEGSYSAVARRFGVSRQAIQQVITQEV